MEIYEKIVFEIIQDEDEYPPVSSEAIWGVRISAHEYVLDNVPHYAYGISKKDVIMASVNVSEFIAVAVLARGGHSTLRVYVEDNDKRREIIKGITDIGGYCSESPSVSLFAVDVPKNVDFEKIDSFIKSFVNDETISYEDACLQHSSIDAARILECANIASIRDTRH